MPEIIKLHPQERMKFYRELAVVSARFAEGAQRPSEKKSFANIAMEWMRLADSAEAEAGGKAAS